jgi:hypothetical protein
MKITVGNLRQIIRNIILEAGGGTTMPPRPVVNNPMAPSMADREQLGKISIKDMQDPEELPPHLQDPVYDEEETWGPVPPVAPNPYVLPDMYTKDYSVLPIGNIKR